MSVPIPDSTERAHGRRQLIAFPLPAQDCARGDCLGTHQETEYSCSPRAPCAVHQIKSHHLEVKRGRSAKLPIYRDEVILARHLQGVPSIEEDAGLGTLRWPRLFGQSFRFDEWSLCRG